MIWGPLLLARILLVFAFDYYNRAGIHAMMYAGWVIWLISIVFCTRQKDSGDRTEGARILAIVEKGASSPGCLPL